MNFSNSTKNFYYYLINLGKLSLATLVLASCSILPKSTPLQTYLLPSIVKANMHDTSSGRSPSLRIIQPNTGHFLNSNRIAVQTENNEITVYHGAAWGDSVPILLQNRLIQEFRSRGHFGSVSSNNDGSSADYELGGDLVAFQYIHQNKNQTEVLVQFDARIVRKKDGRVIANQTFLINQPVVNSSIIEVVNAFGLASDELSAQILNWGTRKINSYSI